MNLRHCSTGMLCRILAVFTGLIVLAGCGGGSSNVPPPVSPTVSLSPASLTFTSEPVGTPSTAQTVTLSNTGTAALTLTGITVTGTNSGDFSTPSATNTCTTSVAASANCTFTVVFTPAASGARTASVSIADNASNSPQTVSLSGTGTASTVSLSTSSITFSTQVMVGTPSTAQTVTVNNTGTAPLTFTSIVPTGPFTETDNCLAGVNAGASCTINVTFTPTTTGAANGTLTLTDNSNGMAGTTQTVNLLGAGFTGNSVAVAVNFGPNGNQGVPTANTQSYYNGIYATVTVCEPGTTTCQAIDNVLVDTGSVGLRVLASALTGVTLKSLTDTSGDTLNECVGYADGSFTWGPVQWATVQIGGETATQVPAAAGGTANQGIPIQNISNTSNPPSGMPCISGSNSYNANTVPLLGANGILGVGSTPQDCMTGNTNYCTSSSTNEMYVYCSTTACQLPNLPLGDQVWNPVAAFGSADTNGVIVQLPSIPAAGQASVAGTMVFGIGTETCPGSPSGCTPNGLGSAQVFAQDDNNYFPTVVFNNVTYTSPNNASYVDSGSSALFVSDAATLNSYASAQSITVSDCMVGTTDIGFYCPTPYPPALSLPVEVSGYGGVGSGTITLSIANALTLFQANTSFAAFNNLGYESGGTDASTDSWDFGLPFFFGPPNNPVGTFFNVYTGIEGTNPPNGVSAPYGYWAF